MTPENAAAISEMTVMIIDRRSGERSKYITVTIGTLCPACGGKRGEPVRARLYSSLDGIWHTVDGWYNPCGHIDDYPDVIIEAERLAAATACLRAIA